MTRLRKISLHFTDLFIRFALRPLKNTQPNKNNKGKAIHKVANFFFKEEGKQNKGKAIHKVAIFF